MLSISVRFHRIISVDAVVGRMSNAAFQNTLVKGDTGPRLKFNLIDNDGAAINVSGVPVNFFLRSQNASGHINVGHEACSGVDPLNGVVVYDFKDGDLFETGTYWGDVQIELLDGRKETAYEAVRMLVRESNQ